MNPFLLSAQNRFKAWRELRRGITDMPLQSQLRETAKWWAQCPISARMLDPYDTTTWPTCWELLHYGDFCTSAISLGMEQTLIIANRTDVELLLIDDKKEGVHLMPLVANKYLLNWDHGQVRKAEVNNFDVIDRFKHNGKKHIQLDLKFVI